jgi:hypothetical protein
MDGLVRALEERGMPVSVARGEATATSAVVDEEAVTFFLEERVQRVERPPTRQQQQLKWLYLREYDYVATGALHLRIDGLAYLGVRRTWADGKRRRLETCLGSFVLGLRQAASALKHQRVERAERERQYELERQRRIEVETARQLEEARVRVLDGQMVRWRKARRIREYLGALKAAGVISLPPEVKIETMGGWLQWAGEYANRLDPLLNQVHM